MNDRESGVEVTTSKESEWYRDYNVNGECVV